MKRIYLFIALSILSSSLFAQWATRAPFPGTARAKATTFTINDKFYLLGGVDNFSTVLGDFWEYDITTNTWTQKPNFPGQERYGAVAFVLGNLDWIATGGNNNGNLDDMWQYDPATSTWVQRIGLPAGSAQHENQRVEAFGFVINNKLYLGGGQGWVFGANSTNSIAFSDLWEYNTGSNSWTEKNMMPDAGKNMAIAGVINDKAYIGLGCDADQTTNRKSLWEYDPATDLWTAKADFPTNFTADAGAFVIDSDMYVVGGVNLSPVGLSNQFYKYELSSNAWISAGTFSGGSIAGQFVTSSGNRVFMGGGYTSSIIPRNDLWEYTSATTGLNEPYSLNGIGIYPNPAHDFIRINTDREIKTFEAFDITGKKVIDVKNENYISVESLIEGVYQVRVNFKDGSSSTDRFIKMN